MQIVDEESVTEPLGSLVATEEYQSYAESPIAGRLNDLIDFMSIERRAFLIGAGCSKCAGLPLTKGLTDIILASSESSQVAQPLTQIRHLFGDTSICNIEDLLSELVDYLAILDRRERTRAATRELSLATLDLTKSACIDLIDWIKEQIHASISTPMKPLRVHRDFVAAVHGSLRSGRTAGSRPVDYFVLNYDTLFEDALALEKIRYVDGLTGGTSGWWDPVQFDDRSAEARVFKIHGSIDWRQLDNDPFPRRVRESLDIGEKQGPIMIWPASTKYRETQADPFAHMLKIMRESLHPSSREDVVLSIIGYSFSDNHINAEIEAALKHSDSGLTVLAFIQGPDIPHPLTAWLADTEIGKHILVYAEHGFIHGKQSEPFTEPHDWWKFEGLTSLLRGKR